jgi:hypothetical protein
LLPVKGEYPQFIEPLNETTIKDNKAKRLEALNSLLGSNLKIEDDFFKFNPEAAAATTSVIAGQLLEIPTHTDDDEPPPAATVYEAPEKADSYKMYTFYNDLNVSIASEVINGEEFISTTPNPDAL